MTFSRNILKNILSYLARRAIEKHKIEFVVVVGWYGTDLIKEGIYQMISEKYNTRRNIAPIWWDLSIPLLILGYKDKKRSVFRWTALILKTSYSLLLNPVNHHKIILDLCLADENTSKYWSKMIKPEVLIVTSYKKAKDFTIEELVRETRKIKGEIFVSSEIKEEKFDQFDKYGYQIDGGKKMITIGNEKYEVDESVSPLFMKLYSPVIATGKHFEWSMDEIMDSLIKVENVHILTNKIKLKLEN